MKSNEKLVYLVKLFILAGLITVEEGRFCLFSGGKLPMDIMKRVHKKLMQCEFENNKN
jgi:hypothetical protein